MQAVKRATKAATHGIVSILLGEINIIQNANNGVIKHGVINKLLIAANKLCQTRTLVAIISKT